MNGFKVWLSEAKKEQVNEYGRYGDYARDAAHDYDEYDNMEPLESIWDNYHEAAMGDILLSWIELYGAVTTGDKGSNELKLSIKKIIDNLDDYGLDKNNFYKSYIAELARDDYDSIKSEVRSSYSYDDYKTVYDDDYDPDRFIATSLDDIWKDIKLPNSVKELLSGKYTADYYLTLLKTPKVSHVIDKKVATRLVKLLHEMK